MAAEAAEDRDGRDVSDAGGGVRRPRSLSPQPLLVAVAAVGIVVAACRPREPPRTDGEDGGRGAGDEARRQRPRQQRQPLEQPPESIPSWDSSPLVVDLDAARLLLTPTTRTTTMATGY